MRYGPNLHELDPAVRRKSTQSLKKAAPGAPFGWTSDGKPYIGTQYAVRGTQFCSISTRSGAPSYYWKPLSTVSLKVALSAIETHGSVDNLFGGETFTPCSEILSASEVANVRAKGVDFEFAQAPLLVHRPPISARTRASNSFFSCLFS